MLCHRELTYTSLEGQTSKEKDALAIWVLRPVSLKGESAHTSADRPFPPHACSMLTPTLLVSTQIDQRLELIWLKSH